MEDKTYGMVDLVREGGSSRATIHHYRRLQLLPPPLTSSGRHPRFGQEHIDRLKEIRRLRREGVSLPDIRGRLGSAVPDRPDGPDEDDAGTLHVLGVATTLLLDKGFEATSMADIADAADVSKATLYLSFPSKEALLVRCIERIRMRVIAPSVRAAADGLPLAEQAKARSMALLHFSEELRALARLLLSLGESDDPRVVADARDAYGDMATNSEPMYQAMMASGTWREVDSELLSHMLWGASLGLAERLSWDDRFGIEEAARLLRSVTHLGLAPRPISPARRDDDD